MGRVDFGHFGKDGRYFCEYCSKYKDVEEFAKDKSKERGFKSKCKECYNEYIREWNKKS
jgi:hypothetical protein